MSLRDKLLKDSHHLELDRSKHLSKEDLDFVSSLDEATLETATNSTKYIIWTLFIFVITALIWANYGEIDEITKGAGKVVTSKDTQKIQYLEGGIVSEILVQEGDRVQKGETLLKVDDIKFTSQYQKSSLLILELEAKNARLLAQIENSPIIFSKHIQQEAPLFVKEERKLFNSNIENLQQKLNSAKEQIKQKKTDLEDAKTKKADLETRYFSLKKEVDITEPLAKKGVISEIEFLKLKRDFSKLNAQLESIKISINKLKSIIKESQQNERSILLNFQNSSKQEYNENLAQIERVKEDIKTLKDKVGRTVIKAPVDGKIHRVFINTIGGVVPAGRDLIEIIPSNEKLLAEVKIKPSDIAFLYPGQEAVIKFSAYDFSIYGGLRGEVTHISADTIRDENGVSYYLVKVATDKNHFESSGKNLKIIVGMTVNVDILTGKKSVLDYLLKPILKAKENALKER